MRTPGPQPLDLLSPAGDRVGGEPSADAADRRAVPQDPVLRQPEDDGVPGALRRDGQSEAGSEAHGVDGTGGVAPQAADTVAASDARVYPYLLRDRVLTHIDEVWSS